MTLKFQLNSSSIPFILSWLHHISWLKYANEAMTIIQWEGVTNISNSLFSYASVLTFSNAILFIFIFLSLSACNLNAQICLRSAEDIFNQYDFSVDNFFTDFYALFLLYLAFNVLAFLVLWLRVRNN